MARAAEFHEQRRRRPVKVTAGGERRSDGVSEDAAGAARPRFGSGRRGGTRDLGYGRSMSDDPGTIHVERVTRSAWLLALRGEHDDASGTEPIGRALRDIAPHHLIVIDLTDTIFLETLTLARLLDAASRHREAGGAAWFVVKPDTFAGRLFDVTGFNGMLEVFESREAAIAVVPPRFS
jgi:anti-anti-sigma regulatory factor